jgi:surface antigen
MFVAGLLIGLAFSLLWLKPAIAESPSKLNEDYVMRENPEVTEQLYEEWLNQQTKRPKQPSGRNCSCVLFAKARTTFSQSIGAARNWTRNSFQPVVGGVVITNESSAGHVAIITAVREDSFDVIEANYVRCQVTTRTIPKDYKLIIGYWYGQN